MPAGWVSAAVGVVGAISADGAQDDAAAANKAAQQGQQMIQMEQLAMQKQQWQRYLDTYAPLEDEYAQEARNVGSIANQNAAAGKAAAANSSAYAQARERLAKNPGMNQSSQAYLQEANKINLADAAGSATSQNAAREGVINRGDARMTDAVSIGKGLPAQAASSLASAGATGSGLMAAQRADASQQLQSDMNGIGAFGKAAGGLFQSKAFQSWLNTPSGGMSDFTGLGGNSNYSGINAASNLGSSGGGSLGAGIDSVMLG